MKVFQFNSENGYLERAIPFVKEVPNGADSCFAIKVMDYEGLIEVSGLESWFPGKCHSGEFLRKEWVVDNVIITLNGVSSKIIKDEILDREVNVDEIFVDPEPTFENLRDFSSLKGVVLNGGVLGDKN